MQLERDDHRSSATKNPRGPPPNSRAPLGSRPNYFTAWIRLCDLREELGLPVSPPKREEATREVYIHHYYHAAPKEPKKKRRPALFMTPSSSRPGKSSKAQVRGA
ncbi:hypothetical protein VUR80DRAFT_2422 [Thermomyces stellatus]